MKGLRFLYVGWCSGEENPDAVCHSAAAQSSCFEFHNLPCRYIAEPPTSNLCAAWQPPHASSSPRRVRIVASSPHRNTPFPLLTPLTTLLYAVSESRAFGCGLQSLHLFSYLVPCRRGSSLLSLMTRTACQTLVVSQPGTNSAQNSKPNHSLSSYSGGWSEI